jgi:hypothetical protein
MKQLCTILLLVPLIISCTGGPAAIHTQREEGCPFNVTALYAPTPAKSGSFLHAPKEDTVLNTGAYIRNLLIDKKGNLWFTTHSNGFGVFDGRKQYLFENKAGIAGNVIRDIVEDKSGNIWLATNGGLYRYNAQAPLHLPESYTNYTTNDGIISNQVWCLTIDTSDNLWIGTETGVCKFDGKIFTTLSLPQRPQANLTNAYPAPDMITSLYIDNHAALWIGTNGGGAYRYTTTAGASDCLQNSCKHDLNQSDDFRSHQSSIAPFFTHYSEANGLCNNFIQSITGDQEGHIWFGTRFGGAGRFDGKSFTTFNTSNGLTNNFIWTVKEDTRGNLWFASAGGGVSKFDGKSFAVFTLQDGLASDYIQSVVEDKEGNIWFGTSTGITRYDGNSSAPSGSPDIKDKENKKHLKSFPGLRNGC